MCRSDINVGCVSSIHFYFLESESFAGPEAHYVARLADE